MKKIFFKILINVVIIINIFILFDWFLFASDLYRPRNIGLDSYCELPDRYEVNLPYKKNKRPIVTIGCSFVYGFNLKDNETLAYKLQKYTGRKTYNLGNNATGIQHVLYQLQNSDFFKNKDLNPEYVIYVFITDHIRRMYADYFLLFRNEKYFKYEYKNGKFQPKAPKDNTLKDYFQVTYFGKYFNNFLFKKKTTNDKFDLLKTYLEESKKALNEKFPDAKLAVVVYNPDVDTLDEKPFYTDRWKELEEEGIKIIDFSSSDYFFLNDKEYKTPERKHPNAKAWDKLVPVIAESLNL